MRANVSERSAHPSRGASVDGRTASAEATKSDLDHLLWLVPIFLALHLPFCLHDMLHPDAWLRADRAVSRLKKIEHLLAAGGMADLRARLIANGPPGDYLLQALPYALWGRDGVIGAQLLLGLIATLAVFALGRRWLGSPRAAFAAAVVFMLLPASLMHPHVLASEAVYNPLVAVGFALTAAHLAGRAGFAAYALGLAAFALAIFTRTQLALFPLLLIGLLVAWARKPWTDRAVLLVPVLCLAPLILWTAFVYLSLGTLDAGPTNYSLGHNLYLRAARVAQLDGARFEVIYPGREMPPGDFVAYAVAAPVGFLKTVVSDAVNLLANPGTYALFGQHLGVLAVEGDWTYWTTLRDQQGMATMLLSIAAHGPGFALAVFGGALLWGVLLLLAATGAGAFLSDGRRPAAERAYLVAFVLYSLVVPFAAWSVRWPFRSAIDFALAPLCVLGAVWLHARLRRRREDRGVPVHSIRGGSIRPT